MDANAPHACSQQCHGWRVALWCAVLNLVTLPDDSPENVGSRAAIHQYEQANKLQLRADVHKRQVGLKCCITVTTVAAVYLRRVPDCAQCSSMLLLLLLGWLRSVQVESERAKEDIRRRYTESLARQVGVLLTVAL